MKNVTEKDIEISVEAFGSRRLTTRLSHDEMQGKSVSEIVQGVVNRGWTGEDKRVADAIRKEMGASGSYTTSIAPYTGGPIEFQPVRLGEKITPYIHPGSLETEKVRIAVTGDHTVGSY